MGNIGVDFPELFKSANLLSLMEAQDCIKAQTYYTASALKVRNAAHVIEPSSMLPKELKSGPGYVRRDNIPASLASWQGGSPPG